MIEECLMKHPKIEEAVVFGIPINDFEQELCAWVKIKSAGPSLSIDQIKEFCKKSLLVHQIPTLIKIVDQFPVSKLGKYLRTEMTNLYRKELGL